MTIMFMAIQEALDDPEGMQPVQSALCELEFPWNVADFLLTFFSSCSKPAISLVPPKMRRIDFQKRRKTWVCGRMQASSHLNLAVA